MTRWNETCVLVKREYQSDDEGVRKWKETRKKVFCNSYTLSTQSWASARMANYNAEEELQLRTADYEGEADVVYRGKDYSVFQVMNTGDFTRLLLQRRDSDIGLEKPPAEETPDESTETPEEPETGDEVLEEGGSDAV